MYLPYSDKIEFTELKYGKMEILLILTNHTNIGFPIQF